MQDAAQQGIDEYASLWEPFARLTEAQRQGDPVDQELVRRALTSGREAQDAVVRRLGSYRKLVQDDFGPAFSQPSVDDVLAALGLPERFHRLVEAWVASYIEPLRPLLVPPRSGGGRSGPFVRSLIREFRRAARAEHEAVNAVVSLAEDRSRLDFLDDDLRRPRQEQLDDKAPDVVVNAMMARARSVAAKVNLASADPISDVQVIAAVADATSAIAALGVDVDSAEAIMLRAFFDAATALEDGDSTRVQAVATLEAARQALLDLEAARQALLDLEAA